MKKSTTNIHVLIGDNSLEPGVKLMRYLRENGFAAYCRRNDANLIAEEAVALSVDVLVIYSYSFCGNIFDFITKVRTNAPYIRIIVVTTKPDEFFTLSLASYGVYLTLSHPFQLSDIKKFIVKNVVPAKYTPRFQRTVLSYLVRIKFPIQLKGAEYIAAAVEHCVKNPSIISIITTDLYEIIAEQFNVTTGIVERSIRHSIDIAMERKLFNEFASSINPGFSKCSYSFSNAEFIIAVADKFCMEYGISQKSLLKKGDYNSL
jgi:hypothetical protein